MIMVLGPHKKKTEAMAEAREAQAARKAGRLPENPSEVEQQAYDDALAAEAEAAEADETVDETADENN
jgi:translation initiation factor IF-3